MKDSEKEGLRKQSADAVEATEASTAFRQEVEQITEAVTEVVSETSLADKVDDLRTYIDNISEDVEGWRTSRAETYVEALETLKSQVEEIQTEWNVVSSSMKSQREGLPDRDGAAAHRHVRLAGGISGKIDVFGGDRPAAHIEVSGSGIADPQARPAASGLMDG